MISVRRLQQHEQKEKKRLTCQFFKEVVFFSILHCGHRAIWFRIEWIYTVQSEKGNIQMHNIMKLIGVAAYCHRHDKKWLAQFAACRDQSCSWVSVIAAGRRVSGPLSHLGLCYLSTFLFSRWNIDSTLILIVCHIKSVCHSKEKCFLL